MATKKKDLSLLHILIACAIFAFVIAGIIFVR